MFNEKTLQNQLANHNFQMYFHPQYDAASSRLTGVDTIVKYHNNDTLLDYNDFSAELEEKNLVGILDIWVLDQIFQLQEHTIKHCHAPIRFSVNVSAWTVSNPFHVYDIVLNLKKYSLPQGSIQANLTNAVPCAGTYGLEKGIGFLQRQGIDMKPGFLKPCSPLPSFAELEKHKANTINNPARNSLLSELLTQEEFYNIQRC